MAAAASDAASAAPLPASEAADEANPGEAPVVEAAQGAAEGDVTQDGAYFHSAQQRKKTTQARMGLRRRNGTAS